MVQNDKLYSLHKNAQKILWVYKCCSLPPVYFYKPTNLSAWVWFLFMTTSRVGGGEGTFVFASLYEDNYTDAIPTTSFKSYL